MATTTTIDFGLLLSSSAHYIISPRSLSSNEIILNTTQNMSVIAHVDHGEDLGDF